MDLPDLSRLQIGVATPRREGPRTRRTDPAPEPPRTRRTDPAPEPPRTRSGGLRPQRPERNLQEVLDEAERLAEARIVGRAETRKNNATERWFLLQEPPARRGGRLRFNWQTLEQMQSDDLRRQVLQRYADNEGLGPVNTADWEDPQEQGWARAVLDDRDRAGQTEYKIRWAVFSGEVPLKNSEEWHPLAALTRGAREMVVQRYDLDQSDSDDEQTVFEWDKRQGRPRVSLQRAVKLHDPTQPWSRQALLEYTLTRIWALRSRVPPPEAEGGPSRDELQQLGADVYEVRREEMEKLFGELSEQQRAENEEPLAWETDYDEFQRHMHDQLAEEALARWETTRQLHAPRMAALQQQLQRLRQPGALDPADFERPRLRLPAIRDFLAENRSEKTRHWMRRVREVHTQTWTGTSEVPRDRNIAGSAYSEQWNPEQADSVRTPFDHVVPQRWFAACELLMEIRDPRQLPAVVVCTKDENSGKGDRALAIFGTDTGLPDYVWRPGQLSDARRAMLARTTCWVFGLYWGISQMKTANGVAPFEKGVGVPWYASEWEAHPDFKQLASRPATPMERRLALLTLALPKWQVANPLVFDERWLDADMRALLLRRFRGEDALSKLIEETLQGTVVGAPR